MNNLERKKLYEKVDEMITWKLDALRDRIWKEANEIPEDEIEEFVRGLHISAVFTPDADTHARLYREITPILQRMAVEDTIKRNSRTEDLLKKLGVR